MTNLQSLALKRIIKEVVCIIKYVTLHENVFKLSTLVVSGMLVTLAVDLTSS